MKKFLALVAVVALVAFAAPAFAANPFMDVPMNSWAYDAISQLSAGSVVSGYPDGTFKGNQPMTRYEMASIVARALTVVDMNKASKQDVEMLKKLVVEFKDELDALGVQVDELDSRVAVLEENLGGWNFRGEFRFDVKLADQEEGAYKLGGDTDFSQSLYRIWMSKIVDDKVKVTARMADNDMALDRYYLKVALPLDFTMWAGLWCYDWEGAKGLYTDNDAWFGDQALQGFYFTRPFSRGDFSFYVAHTENGIAYEDISLPKNDGGVFTMGFRGDYFRYGIDVNFDITEDFRFGLGTVRWDFDNINLYFNDILIGDMRANLDATVYETDFAYNFTPDIALKGAYYFEDLPSFFWYEPDGLDDTPEAWKAILDINQQAFGFTSVWIEYAQFDPEFLLIDFAGCDTDGNGPWDNYGAAVTPGLGFIYTFIFPTEVDVLFVKLQQEWNDKWTTFQRYVNADHGFKGSPFDNELDVTNWTFGIKYNYSSNLSFELVYDNIEYEDGWIGNPAFYPVDDSLIRLRTHVIF